MKTKKQKEHYYFVDEAGDPVFFDKYGNNIVGQEGCSKILLLGLIKTNDPKSLRQTIDNLRKEIVADPYLQNIPSLKKTALSFHAKDDAPEVREKVFKAITNLNFTAEFIVARKIEALFRKRHQAKQNLFYDDLIIKLLENKLHLAEKTYIYFSVRGNKTRQAPLEEAIQVAKNSFESKHGVSVDTSIEIIPQSPIGEPCLQIVDYMNWAVQRAFTKGEDRFYKFIENKVKFLCDVYDFDKYPDNYYSRGNKFDVNKISPL